MNIHSQWAGDFTPKGLKVGTWGGGWWELTLYVYGIYMNTHTYMYMYTYTYVYVYMYV